MAKAVSTVRTRIEMTAEGGVQEANYDNSVDCRYAMPVSNPVLQHLMEGGGCRGWGGGCLQVAELVHQQQGARQAGQAGFRATTVTARVAS